MFVTQPNAGSDEPGLRTEVGVSPEVSQLKH